MNQSILDAIIPIESHGQRIDIVLAQLFPDYSRSQLSTWLKAGKITIGGKSYKPKDKVIGGENVQLTIMPTTMAHDQPEYIPLDICYEDDALLIINKPAGLVVHPGAGNPQHTLVNALLHYHHELAQLPRAGIIHRLDKDTTGLLLIGKTLPAYTDLTRQMQAREIQRAYQALVYGRVISGGHIETYYGRHPHHRLKMAVCKQGREAITDYTVQKRYDQLTLLEVQLQTGRTHQIRVHMAHVNHPIVGDGLYGGRLRIPAGLPKSLREALLGFKRQALHAFLLSLSHPLTDKPLTVTTPMPDDFHSLLTLLETCHDSDSL